MNWKGIFAHEWSDATYEKMRRFLRRQDGDQYNESMLKRAQYGYKLKNDRIVLEVSPTNNPWIKYTNNTEATFVMNVVPESERANVVMSFLRNMRSVSLNAHTLLDKIHRAGYLGISRRYLDTVLENTPEYRMLRDTSTRQTIKAFRPTRPFEHWQADLIDLQKWYSSNRGYRYILVIIDIFTKFVYMFPVKQKDGFQIAKCFNKVYLSGDVPNILHTDQGSEFVNQHVKQVCAQFFVNHITGDGYSPQTQGFVESKNKHIKSLLNYYMISTQQNAYIDILEHVAFSINNTKHHVTGFTPLMLHRGRQPPSSISSLNLNMNTDVESNLAAAYYEQQAEVSNERNDMVRKIISTEADKRDERYQRERPVPLRVGDRVRVATYTRSGQDVQPILLKLEGERIRNPLTIRIDDVVRELTDIRTRKASEFKKVDLNTKKHHKIVFVIKQIIEQRNKIKLYVLEDDGRVLQRLVANVNEVTELFHKNMLVKVDNPVTSSPIVMDKPDVPYLPDRSYIGNNAGPSGVKTGPSGVKTGPSGNNVRTSRYDIRTILYSPVNLKKVVINYNFDKNIRGINDTNKDFNTERIYIIKGLSTQRNVRDRQFYRYEAKLYKHIGSKSLEYFVRLRLDYYEKRDDVGGWWFEDNTDVIRRINQMTSKQIDLLMNKMFKVWFDEEQFENTNRDYKHVLMYIMNRDDDGVMTGNASYIIVNVETNQIEWPERSKNVRIPRLELSKRGLSTTVNGWIPYVYNPAHMFSKK